MPQDRSDDLDSLLKRLAIRCGPAAHLASPPPSQYARDSWDVARAWRRVDSARASRPAALFLGLGLDMPGMARVGVERG